MKSWYILFLQCNLFAACCHCDGHCCIVPSAAIIKQEHYQDLKGNCIGFFHILFILIDISPVFPGKKELVLLVELYENYGRLKTHTHTHDVM